MENEINITEITIDMSVITIIKLLVILGNTESLSSKSVIKKNK